MVRFVLGLSLLVFLGVVGVFAVQNTQPVTVAFWSWGLTAPVALVAVASYVLGMISGWSVVGFVRNSLRRVRSHSVAE